MLPRYKKNEADLQRGRLRVHFEVCLLSDFLEQTLQIGGEDDLGAAVDGLVGRAIVWHFGCKFAVAACLDTSGVNVGTILEKEFDDGGGTHDAEVPVVLDSRGTAVGIVVGMAFDHDVEGGVVGEHFGKLFDGVDAVFRHRPAGRREEQFVLHGDIYFAVFCLDLETFVGESEERAAHGRAHSFQLTFLGLQLAAGGGFLVL